jgi:hypothetical protein
MRSSDRYVFFEKKFRIQESSRRAAIHIHWDSDSLVAVHKTLATGTCLQRKLDFFCPTLIIYKLE